MIKWADIQSYCEAIALEFQPRRIVVFGSYVYGRPTDTRFRGVKSGLDGVSPYRGGGFGPAFGLRSQFVTSKAQPFRQQGLASSNPVTTT